jgi:TrpR-related protein YerC/YecD
MIRKEKMPRTDDMYEAILSLKTLEECKAFFSDLCSISEIMALEQRFAVAKLLYNNYSYSAITEKTKASSAIVSRVNRSLIYGEGGYKIVFERIGKEEKEGEEEG